MITRVVSPQALAGMREDSFGGQEGSGWGREMGQTELENYLETKSVVTELA